MQSTNLSRRSFLALAAAGGAAYAASKKGVPIGVELYSVRDQMKTDLMGTVRAVAKMGYQGVEFYSPYMDWTTAYAKDVRKLLDEVGMKCYSTHNGSESFDQKVDKAIELNQIIGSKYIVMAHPGKVEPGVDGWKKVADKLNKGAESMKKAGIRAGYHNHGLEWKAFDDGKRPMDIIAANTSKDIALQLDVGTTVESKVDPVAWINANPGRIKSIHLKEWSPEKGYKVLFGEGAAPWKKIFEAAEKRGGVEYYLIEQEGSDLPPMETIEKCLATYKQMRNS